MIFAIAIIVIAGAVTGLIAYQWKVNKIKKGWNSTKDGRGITNEGLIGASAGGLLFTQLVPEIISMPALLTLVVVVGTAYTVTMAMTYNYGRKYDPDETILKEIG